MMFFLVKPATASAFTSGTISGTSGSIRQVDELSITTAPAAALFGDHSLDTAPPADSREFAFVQDVEHFPPDIAGRSDQRDFVTHRSLSEQKCFASPRGGKGRGSASMRETASRQR